MSMENIQPVCNDIDKYIAVGGHIYIVHAANCWCIPDEVVDQRFGKGTATHIYQHKYYEGIAIETNQPRDILLGDGSRLYNIGYKG